MRKAFLILLAVFASLALSGTLALAEAPGDEPAARGLRKIVVFKEGVAPPQMQAAVAGYGGQVTRPLALINAVAAVLPDEAARARLAADPRVLRVDDDLVVRAVGEPDLPEAAAKPDKPGKPQPSQPPQSLPWGVDRIDADRVWGSATGKGVRVAIIDSGIDLDHPDLKDNVKGGINILNPAKSPDDDYGHGTHVAGTVAARNNTIGVAGVAPEAELYAVKVLNRSGFGWLSDIIAGLEWSVQNGMQVANMSIGGGGNESYHDAIKAAYGAGIVIVAAAGNDGENWPGDDCVNYPAAYPETIAVAASGDDGDPNNGDGDYIASFSSRGPEVDITGPGVAVPSTWKGGGYREGSGTSMATPHVTGVAALVIQAKGSLAPDAMKSLLKGTAERLEGYGDSQQGAGLVDAEAAVR